MPDEPFSIATVVDSVLKNRMVIPSVRDYKLDALNGTHDLALNIPQSKPYNQPSNLVSCLTKYQTSVEFSLDGSNPRSIRWRYKGIEGAIHVTYIAPEQEDWGDFTKPPK